MNLVYKILGVAFLFLTLTVSGWGQLASTSWRTATGPLLEEPGSALLTLNLVNSLERDRNFPLAISTLGDLLREYPNNPLLLLKRGNMRLRAGQLLPAKADFEKVLGLGKLDPDALYGLVKIQEVLQDWERSLGLCQTILSVDSGNFFAILHSGWACFQMKRFDEALKWYSHSGHSRQRKMALGRGWTLIRLKETVRARQAFEEVVSLNPYDPEGLEGLREVDRLALNGQMEAVAAIGELDVKQAMELLPSLRQQGRIIEALQVTEAVLAREPLHSGILSEKAQLLALMGRWFEAEQCYSVLLQKENNQEYLRGRMSALFFLGRLSEAAVAAREVLKRTSTDTLALKLIADDLYALGKFNLALEYYEKLPADLWAWQGKGWCHLVLGNLPAARKAFQDLLARYPGNSAALEGLRRIGE